MVKRQISQNEYIQPYAAQNNVMTEVANAFQSFSGLASTWADIKKKEDEVKMNDYIAEANIEAMNVTQKWKVDNASDPMNVTKLKELDASYDEIFNGYNDRISAVSRGDWLNAKQTVKNKYLTNNAEWAVKQVIDNAQTSLNSGIDKSNKAAYLYGTQGDYANAQDSFFEQKDALIKGARGILPDTAIADALENFKSDFVKNYIQGLIILDPNAAEEMLSKPETLKDIDSKEAVDLLDRMVQRQKKQLETNLLIKQKAKENEVSQKLIEDPDSISVADLQKMDLLGEIRSAYYSKALKYKADAVHPENSDPAVYNKITDMLTGAETKKDGSLYSAEEVGVEILSGGSKLSKSDAAELSRAFPEKRKTLKQKAQKMEAEGLKIALNKMYAANLSMVAPDDDKKKSAYEYMKKKINNKMDEIVYNFNRQIQEENASPERIKALARAYKAMQWKEIDPAFEDDVNVAIDLLTAFDEGEIIYNKETGQTKKLTPERTWADQ
jgi:hypothetical protein